MVKSKAQINTIVSRYRKVLAKNNISPTRFILYGSYANGKPNNWSDIDLVVIASHYGNRDPLERMEFLAQKAAEVDDSLEVLGFTEEEYDTAHESNFKDIISQGVLIK